MTFRGPMKRSYATILKRGKIIATVPYTHHADHFDVLLFTTNMTALIQEHEGDTIRTNGASYTEESLREMLSRSKKVVSFYSPYVPLMTTTAHELSMYSDHRAMEITAENTLTSVDHSIDFSAFDSCCSTTCDY